MQTTDLKLRADEYQRQLPGIGRAALVDAGLSPQIIERSILGWDREHLTVPIRNGEGEVVFFERWDPAAIGEPIEQAPFVELYPWHTITSGCDRLLIAEGVHEALVLESQGFPAITATGSGRFFKRREWAASLAAIPRVVLAYRHGEKLERRRCLLSRSELTAKVLAAIPHATVLEWPEAVGRDGGAYEFFVTLGKTKDELEALLQTAP